jgi:hypothetical protein
LAEIVVGGKIFFFFFCGKFFFWREVFLAGIFFWREVFWREILKLKSNKKNMLHTSNFEADFAAHHS